MRATLRYTSKIGILGGIGLTVGSLIYYRPVPLEDHENHANITNNNNVIHVTDDYEKLKSVLSKNPRKHHFLSTISLADKYAESPPYFFEVGRYVINGVLVSICRFFIYYCGKCKIEKDENYQHFVSSVVSHHNRPLITISNHRSMLDDPALVSSLLPYNLSADAQYLRYSVCAHEYCFSDKLPSMFYAFCGAFNVMPLKRGAGINQKMLLDFARYSAANKWLHIFPEGGIWQLPGPHSLGGRGQNTVISDSIDSNDNEGLSVAENVKRCGKLKWGVGKLIAHSPSLPIIIPFFHLGMETILPQEPTTKKLKSVIPLPGHDVRAKFGEQIDVSDLIAEYEIQYGPLWKYKSKATSSSSASGAMRSSSSSSLDSSGSGFDSSYTSLTNHNNYSSNDNDNDDDDDDDDSRWYQEASPQEKKLYHDITMRIEHALTELNEAMYNDGSSQVVGVDGENSRSS